MKPIGQRLGGFTFIALALVGALVGSMTNQVAPLAGAFDENDCHREFYQGAALRDIDFISFDSGGDGKVDFGDDPHLLGSPRGTAVVCWYDGRYTAQVWGKLFWDAFDHGCGSVRFDFFDTSGHTVSFSAFVNGVTTDTLEVCSPEGGLKSLALNVQATDYNGKLKRLRVRLYREHTLVGTINRYYGD
ncbi:MAG: hypothetical protein QOH60_287 [Mycobacterium sp.]|jgi:hypothetical protein|nr:hypothetical protein [Mycobacterium sp.]